MSIDPDIASLVANFLAVNAGATLLMVILSYAGSAAMLNGLAWLDRWLDTSRRIGKPLSGLGDAPGQPPTPTSPGGLGSL